MKILFLCTGNSVRSIMAEAIFNHKCVDGHQAFSAGSDPAEAVKPNTITTLKNHGIQTDDLNPKHMNGFINSDIDIVITLCDKIKEKCPTLPSKPVYAHFSTPGPSAGGGTNAEKLRRFEKTYQYLERRIDLLIYQLKSRYSDIDLASELKRIAQD